MINGRRRGGEGSRAAVPASGAAGNACSSVARRAAMQAAPRSRCSRSSSRAGDAHERVQAAGTWRRGGATARMPSAQMRGAAARLGPAGWLLAMRRGLSAAARARHASHAWGVAAGRARRLVADWCRRKSSQAGWVVTWGRARAEHIARGGERGLIWARFGASRVVSAHAKRLKPFLGRAWDQCGVRHSSWAF